jgi:hypothetical protein
MGAMGPSEVSASAATSAAGYELTACSVYVSTIVEDEASTLVLGVDESYTLEVIIS